MDVDYPLHLDAQGRTAATGPGDHVRDLIEQVLFTAPGERVNRPGFGTGLLQMVFLPNSEPLAAATQAAVAAALGQWLGGRIELHGVEVAARESTLEVTVRYAEPRTGVQRVATFTRPAP
jgi:phage baseplate assembly protein W